MAITLFHQTISKFVRNAVCILACVLIQPWYLAASAASAASAGTTNGALTPDAAQTADILGIRQEVEQIISLRRSGSSLSGERHQFNILRAHVLRKIFEADLQNQSAESRLEFEIAYAYDAIAREQRKESNIKQTLNAVNFTQFGVFSLVTSSEGLHNQFIYQSVQSLVSGGVGTVLGGASMLYGKVAKASHLTPPEFMWQYVSGGPVDLSNLPPLVVRYLDSREPGEIHTRREILNAAWKQQYKADLADKKTLFGIDDGKARSSGYLYNRLSLLSFLYNSIAGFNPDLLSLLNQVRGTATVDYPPSNTTVEPAAATTSGANDAARLLHLEPLLAELNSLKPGEDPEREQELHITLLETLVSGGLDMAVAGDRCQKECNYQSDVVLAQLNSKQGNFMQKIYEANFIQGGGFGSTAGGLFLTHHVKPAAVTLRVSGGIGLILTGLSFYGMRGFSRKTDTGPNSLADFFNLRPDKGFSPLVMNYLNSPSPKRTDGKSRRQCLIELWTNNSIATVNLKDQRSLEALGSMPSWKKDRVKLVLNRISLLSSLRQEFNEFDVELLELLRKAWPVTIAASSDVNSKLSPSANAAASLLGVQGLLSANEQSDENAKLLITRQVLEGFLAMISDADLVGHEIEVELKAADRLERQRDRIVQLTNSVNFLQGGILGEVAGGLGFRNNRRDSMYTSNIFIISSAISTTLAAISMLEQHGGWRRGEAKPNLLGAAFGKKSEHVMLSPVGAKYLNSVAPNSRTNLTRREVLTKYWKESKVLSVDVKRDSAVQKLSAEGKAHHWWSETIKMINNRITMLFDLRAVLRSSNVGFYELLKAVD